MGRRGRQAGRNVGASQGGPVGQGPMDSGVSALGILLSRVGRLSGPAGLQVGNSGNEREEISRSWTRPQTSFSFPTLPSCPWVEKLRLSEVLYWNGLSRPACTLVLRVSDWPKSHKLTCSQMYKDQARNTMCMWCKGSDDQVVPWDCQAPSNPGWA